MSLNSRRGGPGIPFDNAHSGRFYLISMSGSDIAGLLAVKHWRRRWNVATAGGTLTGMHQALRVAAGLWPGGNRLRNYKTNSIAINRYNVLSCCLLMTDLWINGPTSTLPYWYRLIANSRVTPVFAIKGIPAPVRLK